MFKERKVNKNFLLPRLHVIATIKVKIALAGVRRKRKIREKNLRKSLIQAIQIPFDIRRMTSINFSAIFYMLLVLNLSAFYRTSRKKEQQPESDRETTRNGMKEIFCAERKEC